MRHPLDPLSVEELAATVAAVRDSGKVSPGTRFWGVTLDEDHARRGGTDRRARTVVLDGNSAFEVDVALGETTEVTEWRPLDPRNPGMTSEEARAAAAVCREDPEFQKVLAKRGITDMALVMIDPESIGGFEPPEYAGRRLTWGSVWLKTAPEDNHYARPVQGVVPIIDMTSMTVLRRRGPRRDPARHGARRLHRRRP